MPAVSPVESFPAERWPTAIVVYSKCDLVASVPRHAGQYTSAKTGQGIADLAQAIATRLVPNPPQAGEAVPFAHDQVQQLQATALDLAASNVEAANSKLLAMLA